MREDPGHNPPGCPRSSLSFAQSGQEVLILPWSIMQVGNSASPPLAVHGREVECRELSPGWRCPSAHKQLGKEKPLPSAEIWGAAELGRFPAFHCTRGPLSPAAPQGAKQRQKHPFFDKCLYLLLDRGLLHSSLEAVGRTTLPLLSAGHGGWIGSDWCGPGCCIRCTS